MTDEPVCNCYAPRDYSAQGFTLHMKGCPRYVYRPMLDVGGVTPMPAKPRYRLHFRIHPQTPWCISYWRSDGGAARSFMRTYWCDNVQDAVDLLNAGAVTHRKL